MHRSNQEAKRSLAETLDMLQKMDASREVIDVIQVIALKGYVRSLSLLSSYTYIHMTPT